MPLELPCPGQIWTYANIRVVVIAVSADAVLFQEVAGPSGTTRDSLLTFLEVFRKL